MEGKKKRRTVSAFLNSLVCQQTQFFWVDENEELLTAENDNGQAGYLQIIQYRGDEQVTEIILSPSEIRELRLALQAEEGDRREREEACRVSRPSRPMRAKRKMREILNGEPERANRQSRRTSRVKRNEKKNAVN